MQVKVGCFVEEYGNTGFILQLLTIQSMHQLLSLYNLIWLSHK